METKTTSSNEGKWIFIIIGTIFALVGFFMIKFDIDTKNRMDSQTYSTDTTYTVHKSRDRETRKTTTMYSAIYHYSVDGVQYTCSTGFSSSAKPSKKIKKIKYMANNPSDCHVDEVAKNGLQWAFLLLGCLAIFVGFKVQNTNKV